MINIRRVVKSILFPLTKETIIDSLRKGGAQIGDNVMIWSPNSVYIDSSRPWLLTIGSYTKITDGVLILTHDYSLSTMRRVYGDWIGEGQETIIGKNCFIGSKSILLMGTKLGDNVIVGAGSVVHGSVPDNVVVAGNPARVICTLDEHYKKRMCKSKNEAIRCAQLFYERMHRIPTPKDLSHFKFLFVPRDKRIVEKYNLDFSCNGDDPKEVEAAFYNSSPTWDNYDDFLKEAGIIDTK